MYSFMPSPVLRCRLLLPFRSQLLPAAHFCMQQASALLSARTRSPRGKSLQGFLPSRPAPRPSRSFARFRRSGQPQPLSPARGLPSVHRLQRVRTPCPRTHARSHCRAAFMPGGFKASRRGSPSLPRAACGHFPGFDWRGIPLPLPTKPRPRKGITPPIPARIAHRRHHHCPRPAHRAPPALREPSPSCGGLNPCLSSPCHLPPPCRPPPHKKAVRASPQCSIGLDNGVGVAHVFI